ncbi:hypothetical protein FQZ97_942510 [compost metagenome]
MELVVVTGALFRHVGAAHGHVVAGPDLAPPARDQVFRALGHVLVVHQQVVFVVAVSAQAHDAEATVQFATPQRAAQDDAALDVVDFVVGAVRQAAALDDLAGDPVTHLDAQLFGAAQDVGVLEVVQASPGAQQLAVALGGLGL